MLATAGRLPAGDAGWAYEMKWDGLRAIATIDHGRIRLESRTGRDITHAYPELQGLAGALDGTGAASAVLDGEIVAFGGEDWPNFEALQQRMNISTAAEARTLVTATPVSYLIFDLLGLGDEVLTGRPYAERRTRLEELGLNGRSWQTPPSFRDEAGADVLAVSKQQGLEGVVAKRLASRYEPGRRSPSWIKVKNIYRQETVVGGWQPGERGRSGQIGSLLIGVYEPGGLVYAGHVGTGFTREALGLLAGRLAPLRRDTSPFASDIPAEHTRYAQWVEPRLVIEVAFTQWTRAGRLRAPSYKGLRDDKDPAEVVREPTF
jgi:bifunctional non-homologous end joining protein LigD